MTKNILSIFFIGSLVFPFGLVRAEEVISHTDMILSVKSDIDTAKKLADPSLIKPLTDEEIREVIRLGADWIKSAQENDGHFAYEYFPYEDRYAEDDNIVRQAGSLFQLGEIELRDNQNIYSLDKTIDKSAKYFSDLTRDAKYKGEKISCIVGDPEGSICKLGTTSLAVMGLINYVEGHPDKAKKYESEIESFARYMMLMQKDTGGFREVFSTKTGVAEDKESPYANGEAFYALVKYAKWKGYPADLQERIERTAKYFTSGGVVFDSSLYLWAMAGMKEWSEFKWNDENAKFVLDYTNWRMAGFTNKRNSDHNYCAYIEGVASAYSVLKKSLPEAEAKKYSDEIDFWLAKSAMLQVGPENLVKYDTVSRKFIKTPVPVWALGGFLTGHDALSQRIDFTQHCLSGYIQKLHDIDGKSL